MQNRWLFQASGSASHDEVLGFTSKRWWRSGLGPMIQYRGLTVPKSVLFRRAGIF